MERIIKDTLVLFAITLIAGLLLGGVYKITKSPIEAQAKAKTEKAYKAAIRKLKKQLNDGAYGQWLSIQKAIRKARADAEADSGYYVPPQTTWMDEKELTERFLCEVVSLIHVHEIFSDALEQETE